MREQVQHGNAFLAAIAELGQVGGHAILQAKLAPLDQKHHAGGGGHRLGERGQIEQRVGGHFHRAGLQLPVAETAQIDQVVPVTHGHDAAGHLPLVNPLLDQGGNPLQGARVHPQLLGLPPGEPRRLLSGQQQPGTKRSQQQRQDRTQHAALCFSTCFSTNTKRQREHGHGSLDKQHGKLDLDAETLAEESQSTRTMFPPPTSYAHYRQQDGQEQAPPGLVGGQ